MAAKKILFLSMLLVIHLTLQPGNSLDNGLALTPPMGWMSWVRYACETNCALYPKDCINQELYKEMADAMADLGYKDVGYRYINIDDCWSEMRRDPVTNKLLPDRQRFPDGIPALSDYIHAKGLRFGKRHVRLSYMEDVLDGRKWSGNAMRNIS